MIPIARDLAKPPTAWMKLQNFQDIALDKGKLAFIERIKRVLGLSDEMNICKKKFVVSFCVLSYKRGSQGQGHPGPLLHDKIHSILHPEKDVRHFRCHIELTSAFFPATGGAYSGTTPLGGLRHGHSLCRVLMYYRAKYFNIILSRSVSFHYRIKGIVANR